MKPSDEAKKVEPTNVQSARRLDDADDEHGDAAGDPARPNQFGDLARAQRRERRADDHRRRAGRGRRRDAAGRRGERAACSASSEAPPSTTMLAKKPSGSKRMIRACRLPRNQRNAKRRAGEERRLRASGGPGPSDERRQGERHVDVAERRQVRPSHAREATTSRRTT